MLAAITVNHAEHQRTHAAAMRAGLERHGISVRFSGYDTPVDRADFHVCWNARQRSVWAWRARTGRPVLVMEAGHVMGRALTRLTYVSIGWNGLAGRGCYPEVEDGGARWKRRYGHLMESWRERDGYALLLGQVPGDASIAGVDFERWAQMACTCLVAEGYQVRYRPHPLIARNGNPWHPAGSELSNIAHIAWDLAGASLAFCYNSTAGVEAVLAGVPTVVCDEGAMALPIAGLRHVRKDQPDRSAWSAALAWTSWHIDEITGGTAWEYLRACALAPRWCDRWGDYIGAAA